MADSEIVFEPRHHPRVIELFSLRDGDLVEVEQWGGWATAQCPPICGLWANVWRGTGVALRLSAPFASLSKGTAVAEMVLEVGRRPDAALRTLAAALHVDGAARDLAARHPAASFAACVAAAILQGHPCEGALGGEAGALVRPWIRRGARQSPTRFLEALLKLSDAPDGGGRAAAERFAVHWVYGICGIGAARARTGLGWDGLVAALACVLGHQSVVLAASANDNGLLHQEVVDFELPAGLGWAARADGVGTNDVRHCVDDPFGWAKDDEDAGDAAVRRRRRQILAYYRAAPAARICAPRGSRQGSGGGGRRRRTVRARLRSAGRRPRRRAARVRRARRRRGGAAVCRQGVLRVVCRVALGDARRRRAVARCSLACTYLRRRL